MTDGIIQEVFRNFMDRNNYDIRDMVIHFPELQQELIEKIKQADLCFTLKGSGMDSEITDCITLEDLIGDNQE